MLLQTIISQYSEYNIFNELYINTNKNGSEFKPLDPGYSYQIGYNPVDGFWYFSSGMTGGAPNNRASTIYKVNSNLQIVDSYKLQLSNDITSTYDSHPVTTINFDNVGNVYFCREKGKNSTGDSNGHNTDILLYKLNQGEKLSSITLIKTIPGFYAYPTLNIYNNTMYITARGNSSSAALDRYDVHKSIDSGATFSTYTVVNTGLGTSARAYANTLYNYDDNDLVIALNVRNDVLKAFEAVYILRSSDGIIWRNAENTFSKNISVNGAITNAELEANYLVWRKANDNYAILFEGGVVRNGKIQLLLSNSLISQITINGNVYQTFENLRFYTFNGSKWSYKDLSKILPNYFYLGAVERTVLFCYDNIKSYIYVVDKTAPTATLTEYSSDNDFNNYVNNKVDDLKGNYYMGAYVFNANADKQRLLILNDIQGNWNNFDDYGNLKLYSPK